MGTGDQPQFHYYSHQKEEEEGRKKGVREEGREKNLGTAAKVHNPDTQAQRQLHLPIFYTINYSLIYITKVFFAAVHFAQYIKSTFK